MQTQKNYKNAGMQILVPDNSVEPFNTMFSGARANAELSSSSSLEGYSTEIVLDKVAIDRVPVISKSGKPLMPCKPAKARKLLVSGKAEKKWSKLGIFYIRLTFDPTSELNKNQKVILSADPGSKFDGYAITTRIVNLTGMSELPSKIADKLESRRRMRRVRRYRNTRQRPKRFDNRNRDGFIAPSQKAKVEFRLTIIRQLCKLFPVTDFAVEDVAFNHYEKRWGKSFSTVEIGKNLLYSELQKLGELHTFKGHETSEERKRLGLKKISSKSKRSPESHATDAIALASLVNTIDVSSLYPFHIWKRYQNARRQLHRFEPDRKGIRRRYGGSNSIIPFKKNDVVIFEGKLARIGGFMGNRVSLHNYNLDNKRFTQSASSNDCHRLFNQKIMFEVEHGCRNVTPVCIIPRGQIPPTAEAGGFPLTP
jgi:hypothetical protein